MGASTRSPRRCSTSARRSARSRAEQIAPRAGEIDRESEYPRDVRELLAEHDILGLPFDEEYGGTGTGTLMLQMAVEEIAKACASSALILMVQELGTLPIRLFGSDELKQRLLPQLRQRRVVARLRALRARGRLDPAAMRTHRRPRRRRVGHQRRQELDHQRRRRRLLRRLRRHRPRASAGSPPSSSRRTAPGFSIGKLEHKLGIRGSPTGSPVFDDVRVPHENVIGEVGRGLGVALGTLERTRLGAAAQAVGIAQGATDYADRLRQGADRLRQADHRPAGDPVQARRHGDRHRRRPRAALQGLLDGRPGRRPRPRPSTPRWRSCSPPTTR